MVAGAGVKRHQRVQAQHQVDALVQRHRGVHGFLQGAVHVVGVVNLNRRKQARQSRAGLHRFGDGHVVPAGAAKWRGLAAVQVGGHQGELGAELPKVVGAALAREQARQLRMHLVVGENTRGQARPQTFKRMRERLASHQQVLQGTEQQPGPHDGAADKFAVGGLGEPGGVKGFGGAAVVFYERGTQLARGDAVGQSSGQKAASRHPHIVLQPGEVHAVEAFLQGAQSTHLVDGSHGAAARQGQSNSGGLRRRTFHKRKV